MRIAVLLSSALILAGRGHSQDLTLKIPPVKTSFDAGGQAIPVTAWGTVSGASPDTFRLALTADLAGLQDNITPLLRTELNRSDRCGERLSVDHAALVPSDPAAVLTVNLRYERWGCAKVFGKDAVKRLVGGNAVVVVKLTPSAGPEGIGMASEVQKIDADGSLGEVLSSGSMGASVKEKIANSIQSAIRKSLDLKAALPPRIGAAAAFESARFSSGPEGQLWISVGAGLRLSPDELQTLARQMKPQ
jgi:hypothetical protein